MDIWDLDLDWQDSWEWVPSTSDHSSISLYQLWVMSTPHIREKEIRTAEFWKVNFSILTHLNFDLFLRMCIITSSVPNLNYYSLKIEDYFCFLVQLLFNSVCWWCKFPHKNLVTHNGCLQKLVDKKVHGVGEGPSHCKNRKWNIMWLSRRNLQKVRLKMQSMILRFNFS